MILNIIQIVICVAFIVAIWLTHREKKQLHEQYMKYVEMEKETNKTKKELLITIDKYTKATKPLYLCDPEKHVECQKTNCWHAGTGDCYETRYKEYARD